MKMYLSLFLLLSLATGCATNRHAARIIFDTDMAPDYDDVGALSLLHTLADSGEARILATVSSNQCPTCVPCIEVINTHCNRPDIPTGGPRKDAPNLTTWHAGARWTDYLPMHYPHQTPTTAQSEDAVAVYRRTLSNQPDHSVTIVTVGFFSNLSALLASGPDAFSPLSGTELVKKKVKQLVSMAGKVPQGREFNVYADAVASQTVFSQWPTPILLSDFDIGEQIRTGKRLVESGIKGSPIVDAFSLCLPQDDPAGRMSWDQTAVLVAVRGASPYFRTERGKMTVHPDGSNTWEASPNGPHEHLLFQMPIPQLTQIIEKLMMR